MRVADAESGERLRIRHACLPQSLLPLELAQCLLGLLSELAIQGSLDWPDIVLTRILGCVLTAVLIGVLIRRLPGGLRPFLWLLCLRLLRLRLLRVATVTM